MKHSLTTAVVVASAVFLAAPSLMAALAGQKAAARNPTTKPIGNMAQIMRGIYFPNSNLIFDVQQNDPGAPKKMAEAGSSTTDKFTNLYPDGWWSRTRQWRSATASICC